MSRLVHYGPTGDADNATQYSAGQSNTGLPDDFSIHYKRMAASQTDIRYDESGGGAVAVNKRSTWRRFYIRISRLPVVETCFFFVGGTANAGFAALLLTVTPIGVINMYNKGVPAFPGTLIGTPGSVTVGAWHQIKLRCTFTTAWPANDSLAEVILDNGIPLAGTAESNDGIGTVQLAFRDVLGRIESTSPSLDIEYANYVCDDAAYPEDSRISAVRVAAVGTFQQWAAAGIPNWQARNTWPSVKTALGGAATGIQTVTSAQKQTYLLEDFATAGITGTILGARAHIEFAQAPVTTPSLIVIRNGVEVDTVMAVQTIGQYLTYRLDVTGWDLTDTFELGILSSVGTTRIAAILMSVEHTTPVPVIAAATDTPETDEVSWTGNDTAQTVALPFEPHFILWWPRSNATSGGVWMSRANSANTFVSIGRGDPNFIVRGSNLYLVGAGASGANINTVVYDALLIRDPAMRMVATGSYSETNNAARDDRPVNIVTPLGGDFAPEAVIAIQETVGVTATDRFYGAGSTGDASGRFSAVGGPVADYIQGLTATGFIAGLSLHTQQQQTCFAAFRRGGLTTEFLIDIMSYTGNGAGGTRVIPVSLSGLVAQWAIVHPLAAVGKAIRNGQQSAAKNLDATGGTYANSITALGVDSITVGTALNANGTVYSVLVFGFGPGPVVPCTGGGTVASGTNPGGSPAPTSLEDAGAPLTWVELTPQGGTTLRMAMSAINLGTPKAAMVQSFGRLTRALCDGDGGPQSTVMTSTFIDTGRTLRALATANTLKHALIEYYTADLETLQSGGVPVRRFRGRVHSWDAQAGLLFSITAEDELTAILTSLDADDVKVPQRLLDTSVTDNNPTQFMFERPAPEAYGNISDEDLSDPVGVWECKHVANITVTGYEHLGNACAFLIMAQVGSAIQGLFSADPLSGSPMTARSRVPVLARGDWVSNPDAYWLAPGDTGYPSADYWYNGSNGRYWLVFGKDGHPVVQLAVDGRIPLTINYCAYETVGDGTGNTINSPPRAFLHWLNNRVVQEATADWLPIADLDDYSLFDTTTFEAVHTLLDALDYVVAGIIGYDFTQRSWRDGVAEWCRNFGFEYGINTHGQVMLTYLDRTDAAASALPFTPANVLERGCEVDMKADSVENEVRYVYARNYLTALQKLNPIPGEVGLREPFDGPWLSGTVLVVDNASISALGGDPRGRRRSAIQEYSLIRDEDTADGVAAERLALRSPPNGRAEITFDLSLRVGIPLELGDIITLEHWDVPWSGARRCQVRQITDDLDGCVITVLVRDVDDLLP